MESAHVLMILESQGVSHSNGKRPDGMTIFPWRMGKCMVWYFAYRYSDTFASVALIGYSTSSNLSEKVAERTEQAKPIPVGMHSLNMILRLFLNV